jgi:hypothetical protein
MTDLCVPVIQQKYRLEKIVIYNYGELNSFHQQMHHFIKHIKC